MRLGTLLLRDAVITLTQLEQSLRAQVLSGGLLGTNLVELGFIDLNTLGRYIARVRDIPLAIADHLEKADPKLIEAFGAELADRYCAFPIRFEDQERTTVGVVMRDPSRAQDVAEIERHLGRQVKPYIAPELRVFYYLERFYGIRRRTRFTRPPAPESAAPKSRRERRATQPFHSQGQPSVVNISPKKDRESPAVPSDLPQTVEVCTFKEACMAIQASSSRDEIAKAIMRFSIGRFAAAAIFVVRAGHALGWVAQRKGLGEGALERLSLPLVAASVFQVAHDSKKPYRGPALTAGSPLEKELWAMMALEYQPTDIHVVPVCLHQQVVNLIYAHTAPGTPPGGTDESDLAQLAGLAEEVYGRILVATAK